MGRDEGFFTVNIVNFYVCLLLSPARQNVIHWHGHRLVLPSLHVASWATVNFEADGRSFKQKPQQVYCRGFCKVVDQLGLVRGIAFGQHLVLAQVHGLGFLTQFQVQHFHHQREEHGKVNVALRNVLVQRLHYQHKADENEE